MSRVLLIDDDSQVNAALSATLRVLGHEVSVAATAEDGQNRMERWRPDVALVDMMLPGTSGLELIAWMAAGRMRIFSCLATGMGDYRLLKQALAAGAWSLMCKPLALPDLMQTLLRAERLMRATNGLDCISAEPSDNCLRLTSSDCRDVDEAITLISVFARHRGADLDTAGRLIPILLFELLQNALTHGDGRFEIECRSDADILNIRVTDQGHGFSWQRELVRCRTNWQDSRAAGLQLVSAAAPEVWFENEGRTACVQLPRQVQHSTISAAITVAAL